jgi:phospholipase C
MAFTTMVASAIAMLVIHYPLTIRTSSLADIDHVVLFMQENRAFDHYFGTMAGVRGFSDPNVQDNSGRSVWYQNINSELTNSTDYLLPWYLNYLGGSFLNATQCMDAGSNAWSPNHAALDGDLNDHWATNNTPWSWAHFRRSDIPVQFAIADAWTVGDMYQESVIAATNPNRVTWISGSINVPGNAQTPNQGGVYIDNNEVPGCEAPGLNCYPLSWKTTPEFYQAAGVTWQVYQDTDNFDDNPLAWFRQYQTAANGSALSDRGMAFLGLDAFYADAMAGTLPQISYIVGPTELSEHQPYAPRDGAWLQKQVVEAVTGGKAYDKTVLIISYDGKLLLLSKMRSICSELTRSQESGGWGDHVTPYHSPQGTSGEWLEDPYGEVGYTYSG